MCVRLGTNRQLGLIPPHRMCTYTNTYVEWVGKCPPSLEKKARILDEQLQLGDRE